MACSYLWDWFGMFILIPRSLNKSLALSTNMGTFITLYSNRPLYSKGS